MQKMFVSTPIYYVNDSPHLGHAYTTFIADMLKKYHSLKGKEVFLLTGTDEHGQKIALSAAKHGLSPLEYASKISQNFKLEWDHFKIDYNYFVRTTDRAHEQAVQHAFESMLQKGDIYKGTYEGAYCVSCESFATNSTTCPDCNRPTTKVAEESYFFRLSRYQDRLLEFYDKHPSAILPLFRRNEVLSFIKQGLYDLSITRTSFEWGIALPAHLNEPKHVVYVWLDALLSYVSALGYGAGGAQMGYFDNAMHIVGKDILRFHAIYWVAFLMSLELPLFKQLCVHGWWMIEGVKMSKSIGNVLNAQELANVYGSEPLRYFLLREAPLGQDGDFGVQALVRRSNADLSNTLGNLVQRLSGLLKPFGGRIESGHVRTHYAPLYTKWQAQLESLEPYLLDLQLHRYLEELWRVFEGCNAAIAKEQPWALAKTDPQKAMALLALVATFLAKSVFFLYSVLPESAYKLAQWLNLSLDHENFKACVQPSYLLPALSLPPIKALFPKLEVQETQKAQAVDASKEVVAVKFEDFSKLDIQVGTITKAERVPKSDKLLCFQIDFGGQVRQILSGIGLHYNPEDLEGKQVCALLNLPPRKMLGLVSEGMVLSASDKEGLTLIAPLVPTSNGAKIG
ncbi:methionine--tRNA ligase [Helicobacter ailurogastricus]|uniref:methionine--tRNA ligase n=1 Tax=Helicobacter ailurogastricus TaxID=1578720 RepID=UPI0022C494D4|nr:methionine--tRNA ligase [Helicobacter ailurogastricus]GLH58665.1 Methionine--tRNA ligase [Helicobacter ailurogastricus]GLH59466.1 Methionine--tRNA ligase [Helicobacter ailurogastricus]